MTLQTLLGIDVPIIQAPMAGVQGSALAIAVSNAGGLGSLPAAMLSRDALRTELAAITAHTDKPFNVNFFCHTPPTPDPEREAVWRATLAPYYHEFGIDPETIPPGPGRALQCRRCRCAQCIQARRGELSFWLACGRVARTRAWGAAILASATTVEEARWLEAQGVDAIIAQGLEAGGHRGMFLGNDVSTQVGTVALVPQLVHAVNVPVIAAGGIADARGYGPRWRSGRRASRLGRPICCARKLRRVRCIGPRCTVRLPATPR
jgi:nitronate monooxygenase